LTHNTADAKYDLLLDRTPWLTDDVHSANVRPLLGAAFSLPYGSGLKAHDFWILAFRQ
jgi:hypothetical protein